LVPSINPKLLSLLLVPGAALWAYKDGPPPNAAGGFGGNTCHTCHSDNPLNSPGGSVVIEGVPAAYAPGATYALTIRLARAGLRVGGFQLAARFESGEPAGLWIITSGRAQSAGGFLQHTQQGTEAPSEGVNQWTAEWVAPASGTVFFHAAGNASNDDASALGDFIYTAEARTAPQ
jgi:hypothetical protein